MGHHQYCIVAGVTLCWRRFLYFLLAIESWFLISDIVIFRAHCFRFVGGVIFPTISTEGLRVDEGHALIHPGFMPHASAYVTNGVRYGFQIWLNTTGIGGEEETASQDDEERQSILTLRANPPT